MCNKIVLAIVFFACSIAIVFAQETVAKKDNDNNWQPLFAADLSDASYPEGVWTVEKGVFTATEDKAIWSVKQYENFVLDLEFKTAPGTNSGVIVYCTDTANWIPNRLKYRLPMIIQKSGQSHQRPGSAAPSSVILPPTNKKW